VLLDSHGRIRQASIAFCGIVGFTRDELVGMEFSEITHADDVETEAEQRNRLASGEIERYQLVERLLRRDGKATWVRISVSACRGVSGLPKYYVLQVENSDGHPANGNGAPPEAVSQMLGAPQASLTAVIVFEILLAVAAVVLRAVAQRRWAAIDWTQCRPMRAISLRGA
jgi:PAS domain S-box-containing protein